jgi:glycosyltransferase involved in cell wall biosynthesis
VYKDRVISVSVPAHNEELLIQKVVETMPDFVDHIVIVDDCSTDATAEKVGALADPRVELVRHEQNKGVGGAILTAHRRALELGADCVVVMAGDAQMDPAYLPALLDPIVEGGCGFAKANRFFSIDSFRGMPRHRIVGNVVLSFMTKLASGYWNLFDPQNGYTAIRRDALERLDLDRIAETYEFENDLLINLNILDVRATDVAVPAVYGQEVSGMRLSRVAPAILGLLTRGFVKRVLWKYVLRGFSPIALFLFTGLALLAWSILFGMWVIWHTLGPPEASTGTVLLAVVPFVIGVELLINALTLDIQRSPDRPLA